MGDTARNLGRSARNMGRQVRRASQRSDPRSRFGVILILVGAVVLVVAVIGAIVVNL
jgi:hypothetical protein